MTDSLFEELDVIIVGASMAGSCLARQLKLAHPDFRIAVIDRKESFDYGIGESMLEVWWDYACKELRLGHYLDSHYYAKHGLRFFFDSPQKDLALEEMSEMGRTWPDAIPAHQIDRKRFDTDLCRMNMEAGIQVMLGCTVTGIQLDREAGHAVTLADGRRLRSRWLVDAAGLNAPLGNQLGLVKPIREHPISSRWMRVRHANVIDDMGSEAWRLRMNYNSRFLSTVHFMYDGYWFWMIPLDEEVFSLGLV